MRLGKRQFDIVILITFFLFSTLFIWIFKLNNLITTFLYLVVPSLYLLVRYQNFRKRILIFALPVGITLSVTMQYLADFNKAWIWPINPSLPIIFKHIPLESFLWYPAWLVAVVALYEIFVDYKHPNQKISKNYKWFIIILLGYAIAFIVWLSIGSPTIEYAYAKLLSLPAIAPVVYILIKKPYLIPRLFKFSLSLLIFTLIYEIIALKVKLWGFPGEYSGFVDIFGVGIPLEEFILWITLGGASVAAYFETFVDDLK